MCIYREYGKLELQISQKEIQGFQFVQNFKLLVALTMHAQRFLDARDIVGQILHFCHNLVEMATTECYLFSNFNVSKNVRLFFLVYCNNSL